jgi:hypothetical protein
MTPTLRPMNLGEILDRSLQIYRRHFLIFLCIGAVPALIVQGISVADATWFHLFRSATQDNNWRPGIAIIRALFAIGYFHFASYFTMIVSPAILKRTAGAVLDESVTLHNALRCFASRWKTYLWLSSLKLTAELLLPEIATIAAFGGIMSLFEAIGAQKFLDPIPGLLMLAGFVTVGFCLFLWIGAALSLALPTATLEGLTGFRSLRRSWVLSRGSRMRFAFTWLAIAIAAWGISVAILFVFRIGLYQLVRASHSHFIGFTLYPIAYRVLNTLLDAVFIPIYPIAVTLFYYDQRIRKEGFDIEQMMAAAGMIPTDSSPEHLSAAPSMPEELNA